MTKEFVILGTVVAASAVVLVETHAWLTRRQPEQEQAAMSLQARDSWPG